MNKNEQVQCAIMLDAGNMVLAMHREDVEDILRTQQQQLIASNDEYPCTMFIFIPDMTRTRPVVVTTIFHPDLNTDNDAQRRIAAELADDDY